MSDEWLSKCLKAAQTPRGQEPSAFDNPTDPPVPAPPPSQGIELGWTDDSVVILLRTPGEPPRLSKMSPEDALTLAESMKKVAMLLLFKKSLPGFGTGSKGSGRSDDSEPESV